LKARKTASRLRNRACAVQIDLCRQAGVRTSPALHTAVYDAVALLTAQGLEGPL